MQFEHNQFDNLLDDEVVEEVNTETQEEIIEPALNSTEGEEEEPSTSEGEPGETEEENDLDAFSTFLKNRGIRDGKTIIYENEETGETEEVDFETLSKEEQLSILESLTDPGLSEDEIETINLLRKTNSSFQDIIAYYQQQAIDEYKAKNSGQETYTVDSYSDDELYLADQKAKFPEMTEEELKIELDVAKSNEDLFKKKVDLIRKQYKEQEENHIKEQEEAEKEQQKAYQNMFVDTLNDFNYISLDYKDPKSDSLILEEKDKNLIYDYVFKQTPEGVTKFVEDLSKPEVIVELAWYRLFGKDTISDISNYWKEELKKNRKATPPKPKSNVTIKKETKPQSQGTSLSSKWDELL